MNPEQALFYSDFVCSGLLTVDDLDYLVSESEPTEINPCGAMLQLVGDDVGLAMLRINPQESRSHVSVQFAGCSFVVEIDVLRTDLMREANPGGD